MATRQELASGHAQAMYDARRSHLQVLDPPAVFWVDKQAVFQPGLYVSLHRAALPPVQANPPPVDRMRPDPWSYYYPRTVSRSDFWSALVPAKWAYEDLLQPLARIEALPVSIGGGSTEYRLRNLQDWLEVEAALTSFMEQLECVAAWPKLQVDFVPAPKDYGYDRTFKSPKILKKAMKKIRAVFVLLVAKLTYLVFLIRERRDGWLEKMVDARRVARGTYERILRSAIFQDVYENAGSFDRVGMILDVALLDDAEWAQELQDMVRRFPIPVWFYYGQEPERVARHSWARQYMPSPSRIADCRGVPAVCGISGLTTARPGQEWEAVQIDALAGWEDMPVPLLKRAPPGPRPNEISRQYPGQTWQEFMAAEEQWMKERAAQETDDQRSARLQLEAQALAKPWPTRSSKCRVFEWREDPADIWTRTYVSCSKGKQIWQRTAPSQRRFNSYRNEWDVCTAFDPAAAPDADEFEWQEQEDFEGTKEQESSAGSGSAVNQDCSPLFAPTPRAPSQSPAWYLEPTWSDRYANCPTPRPFGAVEPLGARHVSMRNRRSCSPRPRTPPRRCRTPPPVPPARASESALQRLSAGAAELVEQAPPAMAGEPEQSNAAEPVEQAPPPAMAGEPEPSDTTGSVPGLSLPAALWLRYGIVRTPEEYVTPADLLPTRVDDLKVRKIIAHTSETFPLELSVPATDFVCGLSFKPKEGQSQPSLPLSISDMVPGNPRGFPRGWQGLHMAVRPAVTPDGEAWYVITSSISAVRQDVWWVLAVQDPLTVNQILRDNRGPSLFQVCQGLLENGIPFKTLTPHPEPVDWLWPLRPMPLFYKDVPLALGVRTDRNYTVDDYRTYVDRRDAIIKSHRGRAAFMRGGIVWRLALECTSYEDVLMGPSGCHTREDYINLDGLGFVDDGLSQHELAVICGSYRVLPDTRLEGRAMFESWWPSEAAWQEGGHSVGYWTPNCEQWFQKRRAGILAGTEKPKNSAAWRDSMKHMKARTHVLLKSARKLAARSLPCPCLAQ